MTNIIANFKLKITQNLKLMRRWRACWWL